MEDAMKKAVHDFMKVRAMGVSIGDQDDAQRFRFWCWMIENHPSLMAVKIANCIYIDEYRKAIDELMVDFQTSTKIQ